MKRLLSLLLFCTLAVTGLQAQKTADSDDAAYAGAVARLMELTNVRPTTASALEGVYMNLRAQLGISEQQAKELAGVVTDAMYDDMVRLYIPIYQKYYSLEELQQLCAFYETPLGRKVGRVTPLVTQEGTLASASIQDKVAAAVQRYLQKIR